MKGRHIGIVLLLAGTLVLGLGPGAKATTECDSDPEAIAYPMLFR